MASEDFGINADYAASMREIGKRFDRIDNTLAFHGQQLSEVSKKLDDQDLALYDQRAILAAHTRDIRDIKTQLNTITAEMREKFDQVIELLTQKTE